MWRKLAPSRGAQDSGWARNLIDVQVKHVLGAWLREPTAHPKHVDYQLVSQFQSAAESADYMVANMMAARNLVSSNALLDFALNQCTIDGLVLEFGAQRAESVRAIAQHVSDTVHGFDS